MNIKNKGLQISNINDEIYTPKYAINPLLKYLDKKWLIWECCYGQGDLKKHFESEGFKVYGNKDNDFFKTNFNCDIIITNPPYSNKRKFIERAIKLNKKFAFLVPITTLEGKESMKLFKDLRIQIIIPSKRINFLPNKKGSWFAVMWLTCGLNLPKDIVYEELI
jgi:hypothetical protein